VQGSRNRCRGHRQHVNGRAYFFEPLLVIDTESLFLVDNQQSEVVKRNIFLCKTMRPDDNIDASVGELLYDLQLPLFRLKT